MPRAFLALTVLSTVILFAPVASATSCPSVVWSQVQRVTGYSTYVQNFESIDYDHDGKLDLVGSIRDDDTGVATLHSWRGVGDGTFETAVSLGTTDVTDLAIANVNNDAYLDLIGASFSGQLWVRLGNATGFNAPIYTYIGYAPYDVHAVNLDGDSDADLLVSSFTSNIFVLYHGVGDGTFTELQRQSAGAVSFDVNGSVVADFDGDTRLDVAVARRSSESVAVYFRNVDSSFAAPVVLPAGDYPNDVQAADFNEDGLPDLVSTNWQDGTIDVFRNLGGRTFSPRLVLPGAPPREHGGLDPFRLLDVNGDAHIDIVAAGMNADWVVTYLGVGDGTFTSGNWYPAPSSIIMSIATGDFDGDTDIDLAFGAYTEHFTALNTCATQVNLYSVSPVITSGQTAELRALISGISSATPLPRGTVAFKEGATTHGTANVDANGLASLDVPGLALGDHTITAEFSGNTVLSAATSASIVQKVTTVTTTTSFIFPPAGSVYGTPYTFNVDIHHSSNFTINDYYMLTVDGVESERYNGASVTLNLTAGQHTLSAKYLGNSFYPPSETGPQVINTAKATPTASKSGDTTVRVGTAHSFQITVAGPNGTTPTGSVQLTRGAAVLGNAALSGGIANFSITLERGAHDVTATYSGDANFNTATTNFTLSVLQNASLAIDARGLQNAISIRAVVPAGTTAMMLFRRVSGTETWTAVGGWSLAGEVDPSSPTRGVLYDYRLDATVSGSPQSSNVDSALLLTDDALAAGATAIKRTHFNELRDAINALRTAAGLEAFSFDPTFAQPEVRAQHVTTMRTALTEARSALGMFAVTFTDPSLTAGTPIKAAHIQEIREAAR